MLAVFIAQFKYMFNFPQVHVDKMKMKTKKRNWALIQYQVRTRREKEQRDELEGQEPPKEKERILRKLNWLRERFVQSS